MLLQKPHFSLALGVCVPCSIRPARALSAFGRMPKPHVVCKLILANGKWFMVLFRIIFVVCGGGKLLILLRSAASRDSQKRSHQGKFLLVAHEYFNLI
jgi:hypothetical protein